LFNGQAALQELSPDSKTLGTLIFTFFCNDIGNTIKPPVVFNKIQSKYLCSMGKLPSRGSARTAKHWEL
jgi:hypothetical protein